MNQQNQQNNNPAMRQPISSSEEDKIEDSRGPVISMPVIVSMEKPVIYFKKLDNIS